MDEEEIKRQEEEAARENEGEPNVPPEGEEGGEGDEEVDYKAKFEAEKAAREEAEKSAETLKDQLQNQSKKQKKHEEEPAEGAPPESPDSELVSRIERIEAREQAVEERNRKAGLSTVKKESWYNSYYTSENDPDGKETVRLSEALKKANAEFPPTTAEEHAINYRRAHLYLHPDEADDVAANIRAAESAAHQKGMAGGVAGSGGPGERKTPKMSPEQVEMAKRFGNDPETVAKVEI